MRVLIWCFPLAQPLHTGSEMRMILLHYYNSLGLGINLPIHASCEDLITAEAGGVLLPAQIRYYFLPLLK